MIIGLKTAKGTKQLKLDPSIYESLQKEKAEVGDVIYIEANSGAVKVNAHFLTLIVPGYSLKCKVFLNSEVYPIFLLLYLSSIALK